MHATPQPCGCALRVLRSCGQSVQDAGLPSGSKQDAYGVCFQTGQTGQNVAHEGSRGRVRQAGSVNTEKRSKRSNEARSLKTRCARLDSEEKLRDKTKLSRHRAVSWVAWVGQWR